MIDLDHFKAINDEFGHMAGDAVLIEFAQRARSVLRHGELLARFGGEEFAVLTRASLDEAERIAERIRCVAAEAPVSTEGEEIAITVSIGAASLTSNRSGEELLAEADAMLYRAKRAGRNRVESRWDQR